MRCFFLPIHVTKRHLVLYIDVECNKKISALAISSVCVKCRSVKVGQLVCSVTSMPREDFDDAHSEHDKLP